MTILDHFGPVLFPTVPQSLPRNGSVRAVPVSGSSGSSGNMTSSVFPPGKVRDAEMMTKIIFERSSQKGGRQGVRKQGQQGTHLEILLSA